MKIKIPVYQPELSGNEKKYVQECLDTSWISSKGKFVGEFEQQFAHVTQINHAISVSNGTAALHVALLALGIGPGDEVIVPSFTYIASVNAIRYVGAIPVFVDIEEDSWQLDNSLIEPVITAKTKAIMAVHMYGCPSDMEAIQRIATQYHLYVIEDCAEAFGTKVGDTHVGRFSDIATYSFFGNKTITTGEGGMVVTQEATLADKVRRLKGQGLMAGREYWHDIVGYNYRMTNICAAIGLAQLEQAEHFIKRKRQIAHFYRQRLQSLPVVVQQQRVDGQHSWWMFSILTETPAQRDKLRVHLSSLGIETRPLFNPVHLMPMYFDEKWHLPISVDIANRGMNLPSWPGMSNDMLEEVVTSIELFFK